MAKRKSTAGKGAAPAGKAAKKAKRPAGTATSRKAAGAKKAGGKSTARSKARAGAGSKTTAKPKTAGTAKSAPPKIASKKSPAGKTHGKKSLPRSRARATSKPPPPGPAKPPLRTIGSLVIYDEDGSLPKTRLTEKDLTEFKQLLLAKRTQLVGDMGNLAGEALGRNRQEAAGDLSSMPIHMADIGSDNWEQEFTLGLIDNERKLLREIDEALARIEDKTYGVCLATHKPISKARLRAKPWAKYCIQYAKLREAGRIPR